MTRPIRFNRPEVHPETGAARRGGAPCEPRGLSPRRFHGGSSAAGGRRYGVSGRTLELVLAAVLICHLATPASVAASDASAETVSAADVEPLKLFGGAAAPLPPGGDEQAGRIDLRRVSGAETAAPAPASEGQGAGRREPSEAAGTGRDHGEQRILRRAEDATGGRAIVSRERAGGGWFSLRDVLPLAGVLGLIAVLALLVRRFLPGRHMLTGGGALEIVARLSLSPKQTLMLIRMGRRLLLIGMSSERMSTLAVVDDPDEVASLIGVLATGQEDSISRAFANSFHEEVAAYHETSEEEVLAEARGHLRGLADHVRRLTGRRDVA